MQRIDVDSPHRRNAPRYAERIAQLVTRIDDTFAAALDELIADGLFESRSDAVRRGLEILIDRHRRRRTADAIVEGYRAQPQTEAELGWSDDATVSMIAKEPW